MILTCPDCSTRYSVKDDAVGVNGRTVRCSSCSATWFVSQDADTLSLEDNFSSGMTAVEAATQTDLANDIPPPQERASAEPVMGAHVQVRDKADQQRRNRRLMSVSMIWIITLGILGAAGTMGYLLRQDAVNTYPPLASFYDLFNISVKVDGLDFEDPATRNIIIDGRPVLVVNGVVINRSDKAQDLPLIELSLLSNSNTVITSWLVELEQDQLGPNQRLAYVSQYPNPPVDAMRLEYRFAPDETLPSESDESLTSAENTTP